MSVSNQEVKRDNDDDGLQDLGVPVPIQTFLWGQIAPFIRPKLGKLHEAACMVSISSLEYLTQKYANNNSPQSVILLR